jgi:hypothetical protein
METPFAISLPEGVAFYKPKGAAYKLRKYAEFALNNLPQMLDKHSSCTLCDNNKNNVSRKKHKRNSSIIIGTAGILMGACKKNVSFSPIVKTKTYKKDAW